MMMRSSIVELFNQHCTEQGGFPASIDLPTFHQIIEDKERELKTASLNKRDLQRIKMWILGYKNGIKPDETDEVNIDLMLDKLRALIDDNKQQPTNQPTK